MPNVRKEGVSGCEHAHSLCNISGVVAKVATKVITGPIGKDPQGNVLASA